MKKNNEAVKQWGYKSLCFKSGLLVFLFFATSSAIAETSHIDNTITTDTGANNQTTTTSTNTQSSDSNSTDANQAQEKSSKTGTAKQLQKFEVTGSHIKRVDLEGFSPVLFITREEIERSGSSTLSDFLRNHPLENGVSFNENINQSLSTSPGGSPLSLRGFGVGTTLVLINGRRVAPYAFAHGGSESFVDLNSIPLGAIDRIEILKDGASAIYGSDAIAGVVNIILRKDYEGTEATLGYGKSSQGDANEKTLNAITGKALDSGNVTFTFDYYSRDEVGRKDRDFSKSANHSNQPGGTDFRSISNHPAYIIDASTFADLQRTGTGDDLYDFNPDITLVPESERLGATLHYSRTLNQDLELFTELGLNRNTTQGHSTPVNFFHFDYTDFLGLGFATVPNIMGPIPGTHPDNPFAGQPDTYIFWRMTEMGLRESKTTTDTFRVVSGLEGTTGKWDWDTSVMFSQSNSEFTENNNVNLNSFISHINDGTLNPYGTAPNTQNVLNAIRATQSRKGESNIYGVEGKGSSEVAELDSGPVQLAIGVNVRHESMTDKFDALTEQGLIIGKGGSSLDDSRGINAVFGELNLPLQDTLELQLALRAENYSDFGSTINPKLALRYQPNRRILLRTSMGTGFRAPSLAQLNGKLLGAAVVVDTSRCDFDLEYIGAGILCIPFAYNTNVNGNNNLDPEKSKTIYFGGVFEPIDNLAVSIDYWSYKLKDMIYQDTQFLLDHECNFPGVVQRVGGGSPCVGQSNYVGDGNDPGTISLINDTYRNMSEQQMNGIDIDLKQSVQLSDYGKFTLHAFSTRMLVYKTKLFSGDNFENVRDSYHFPRVRDFITAGWHYSAYDLNVTRNYTGGYHSYIDGYNVDSLTTYDLQLAYKGIKSSQITFGIENISDKNPPFANEEEGYDPAIHNPIGRFYYASYNYKF